MAIDALQTPKPRPEQINHESLPDVSPVEYWQQFAETHPYLADQCASINRSIEQRVPGAESYPRVLQQLDVAMGWLASAFPPQLQGDVRSAAHELVGDAVYAAAHHLSHDNHTDAKVALTGGKEIPVQFEGTQPLEALQVLADSMTRTVAVMTDPNVHAVPVVQAEGFKIFRFIDTANPGAPAVHVYIRPRAASRYDPQYEYGKSTGVDPSISFNIDNRLLNELASEPFIGDVYRTNGAGSVLSVRVDRDGFSPGDWQARTVRHDALIEQGTASFDGGSVLGGDSSSGVVGRLLGWGNTLRSQAEGGHTRLNHVPLLTADLGHSDVFAAGADQLIEQLERRQVTRAALSGILKGSVTRGVGSGPARLPEQRKPAEAPARYETAHEVLEQAGRTKRYFLEQLRQDTPLRRLVTRRDPTIFDAEYSDAELLARAADAVALPAQNMARWEVLRDENRALLPDEKAYFDVLADRLGMVTNDGDRSSAVAIPNAEKVVLIEGGANFTSVDRRNNARELVQDDPVAVLWQAGSGRHIPVVRFDGRPNPEYQNVTSDFVAGSVLPSGRDTTEYAVGVASALREGWQIDLPASDTWRSRFKEYVEEVAVLHAEGAPDVMSVKPRPAAHGRASLGMAVRALIGFDALADKQCLLIATTAQYAAMATLQAALELAKQGYGNMRVCALGMPGRREPEVYALEAAVLMRFLAEL